MSGTDRVFYLTPMQSTVLAELLHDGPTNEQISDRLDIALDTVKSHMRQVFDKAEKSHPAYAPLTRTSLVVHILQGRLLPKEGREPRAEPLP